MSKLLILKGLPASGKSTYAKSLVASSGNTGRVNRDDLREMIFNGKWTRDREKIIIDVEKAIASVLLDHNHSVVVDDTNFKADFWKYFHGRETVIQEEAPTLETKTFDTPIEECIRRDSLRANPVGRNVIVKMSARNGLLNWPDKPIVLVDIDGTLAASTGREKFLQGDKKDWKSYYASLGTDVPIVHIFKWVAELSKDHTIVIVSGRGAECSEDTIKWFEKIWEENPLFPELNVPRFPVFQWFFRDAGDRRPDNIIKLEVLKLLPTKPVLVIDDRPCVVRAWREAGLRVIPVAGDCPEF